MGVGSVIRHWLKLTMGNPDGTNNGVEYAVGQKLGVFYADNGMIVSNNPDQLQESINLLIGLFKRIVLEAYIAKSKTIICQIGAI